MHIVDFITFQRLPYREMDFENGLFDEWMSAIKHWESLADEYDYISPGHGPLGDISDIRAWRQYFEKLRDAVADGIGHRGGRRWRRPGGESSESRVLSPVQPAPRNLSRHWALDSRLTYGKTPHGPM